MKEDQPLVKTSQSSFARFIALQPSPFLLLCILKGVSAFRILSKYLA
jgi:hypothetical protein